MKTVSPEKINLKALHIMWLLCNNGYETRLCGGAVRDVLMGLPPKDWDMATEATPDQVIEVMQREKIPVIPTGLQHGTVTAVFEDMHIEITTLRKDVETDGRHAVVEFTDSWELDANRRDFTINSMYIDGDMKIHDYTNGMDDIGLMSLRFVGDAEKRIQEDYLRIMRFFRFYAKVIDHNGFQWRIDNEATGIMTDTLDAIKKNINGLANISGERIWSELKKILALSGGTKATFDIMKSHGVFDAIGLPNVLENSSAVTTTARIDSRPSVLLANAYDLEHLQELEYVLDNRFNVSNEELRPISFFLRYGYYDVTEENAYRLLMKFPKSDVLAWLAIKERKRTRNSVDSRQPIGGVSNIPITISYDTKMYDRIKVLDVPEFPISGKDIIAVGIPPGPRVGQILSDLKEVYAEMMYTPSREYLLGLIPKGFRDEQRSI